MNKSALRKKYKNLRKELSAATIDADSLHIANKVLELPIWNYTYYHTFLTIENQKEIDTSYLLHILQGRDKSIVVPKANFATFEMNHILLQENTTIKVSPYGIPEPVSGIEVPPQQMEVVFVPLLAYDQKGNRVGYGKGFYDKFLSKCATKCRFVGLSFFEPEPTIIPGTFDIPLHYCVTPRKIHTF